MSGSPLQIAIVDQCAPRTPCLGRHFGNVNPARLRDPFCPVLQGFELDILWARRVVRHHFLTEDVSGVNSICFNVSRCHSD
jgi:hypothetical protein